eukprot:TRINITY_DN48866_c0_g1_i1.p1 TRINITY_DN48866_c0_g1~~TRINITY_DN48866_c0_g1_i1.p1  ORF type:complete len:388 (-),score=73.16 TRINITY_DN48866_c0_g1_i1:62-1225(-)
MALPGMMAAPSPEWPGAAPGRFTDAASGRPLQRRIVNTECRNGDSSSLARMGMPRYFEDRSGPQAIESKRIFEQRPSDTMKWRPTIRPLSEPGALHTEKPEGVKAVAMPPPKIVPMRERRHLRQVDSKEEYSDRPVGPRTVLRENGLRASEQIAQEVDLTNELQRKARPLSLGSQRNSIGCRSLGDKAYRHPEYDRQFYHAGGLIVGSGFHRGAYPKTEARNATTLKLEERERRPVKTDAERQAEIERWEACQEVSKLTPGTVDENQVDVSWEAYAIKECDSAKYAPSTTTLKEVKVGETKLEVADRKVFDVYDTVRIGTETRYIVDATDAPSAIVINKALTNPCPANTVITTVPLESDDDEEEKEKMKKDTDRWRGQRNKSVRIAA